MTNPVSPPAAFSDEWDPFAVDGWDVYEVTAALRPLCNRLAEVDGCRVRLETTAVSTAEVNAMTELLSTPFTITGPYPPYQLTLVDLRAVAETLRHLSRGNVHLQVRRRESGLPSYYLCRIVRDYWSAYSLVVEDLHLSPGYPMLDPRFVKLMSWGHDEYHIRLSPFRDAATRLKTDEGRDPRSRPHPRPRRATDALLYDVGRYVLQAAWHEDQRPGFLAAAHLELHQFRHAIELLYLCLSGDLCALRGALNETLLSFFDGVHNQPAIRAFLGRLVELDGSQLSVAPRTALELYTDLSRAFGRFLNTEVCFGPRGMMVPMYKPIFANFSRLELVGPGLREQSVVTDAIRELEELAGAAVERMVEG